MVDKVALDQVLFQVSLVFATAKSLFHIHIALAF
jgi:hypothetical protein